MDEKVRLSLQVSSSLNQTLEDLAREMHGSKSDVLRRALTLMMIAHESAKEGKAFGIADKKTRQLEREIVGL